MEAESEMRAIAGVLNEKIFRRLGFEVKADYMYEPGGCFASLNLERAERRGGIFVCELVRSPLRPTYDGAWEALLKAYSSGKYDVNISISTSSFPGVREALVPASSAEELSLKLEVNGDLIPRKFLENAV